LRTGPAIPGAPLEIYESIDLLLPEHRAEGMRRLPAAGLGNDAGKGLGRSEPVENVAR
jgi:hypothetical protein